MNKSDLIERVSSMTQHSKKDTAEIINGLLVVMKETLSSGERVQLSGFGCFECRKRAERMARNLHTMECVKVPATTVPVFRVGRSFRTMINGSSEQKNQRTDFQS